MKRFANNFFKDSAIKSATHSCTNSLQTFIIDQQEDYKQYKTQINDIVQHPLQAKNNQMKLLLPLIRTRGCVNLIKEFSTDQAEDSESNKSSINNDLLSKNNVL